jgi:hypothetical protein
MSPTEKRLAAATLGVDKARRSLADATTAAQGARELVARIGAEIDRYRTIDREISADRASGIKAALLAGTVPTFDPQPSQLKNASALADAEARLRTAEQIAADLTQETQHAKTSYDGVCAELETAAGAVLIAEAETHATRVGDLEQEALAHRLELVGLVRSGIAGRGAFLALSELGRRIAAEHERIPRNTPEYHTVTRSVGRWKARFVELMGADADPSESDAA